MGGTGVFLRLYWWPAAQRGTSGGKTQSSKAVPAGLAASCASSLSHQRNASSAPEDERVWGKGQHRANCRDWEAALPWRCLQNDCCRAVLFGNGPKAHPTKIKQHVARAGRLGPACRVPRECRRGHLEGRIYRTPAWPTSLRTWRRPLHNILANEGALLSVCRLASKGACSKQLGQVFSQCSQSQCALLAEAPGRPTKGLLPAPLNACLSRSRQGCPPRRAHARAPLLVAAQRVLPMLRARAAAPCRAWATAAEASPRCERGGVKGHRGTRALKAPPSPLSPFASAAVWGPRVSPR